jgi:hypothetical protein
MILTGSISIASTAAYPVTRSARTVVVFRYKQQRTTLSKKFLSSSANDGQTDESSRYGNFAHERLTIERSTSQQRPISKNEDLIFGQVFTPHMIQIKYERNHWLAPQIVPYQNLSVSPAASSLHYGTGMCGVFCKFVRFSMSFFAKLIVTTNLLSIVSWMNL